MAKSQVHTWSSIPVRLLPLEAFDGYWKLRQRSLLKLPVNAHAKFKVAVDGVTARAAAGTRILGMDLLRFGRLVFRYLFPSLPEPATRWKNTPLANRPRRTVY